MSRPSWMTEDTVREAPPETTDSGTTDTTTPTCVYPDTFSGMVGYDYIYWETEDGFGATYSGRYNTTLVEGIDDNCPLCTIEHGFYCPLTGLCYNHFDTTPCNETWQNTCDYPDGRTHTNTGYPEANTYDEDGDVIKDPQNNWFVYYDTRISESRELNDAVWERCTPDMGLVNVDACVELNYWVGLMINKTEDGADYDTF